MWRFCVRWVSGTGCHHCCAGVQLTRYCRQCVFTMIHWPIACSARLPIWPSSVDWPPSRSGNLSVSRATRALKFLAKLGLITYQTEYDPQIGCNIPTDITFTPALFSALDVSEVAVVAARRSRVEWENLQRKSRN